jgi:hypothetical protein
MARFGLFRQLAGYLWTRKRLWLVPLVTVLVLVGALLVFTEASALAPFLYTLF